ncbi:hypothetical protein ABL78_6885 [Leptomonas seymouri]|uniref:Uncharacterized protein n=1 Tax=Leptomonas seymouri TaxID=5684 RepID=A0A0N1I1E0_LEPSE|nr:hypothetical protein ABL78_6885 [Leptomonas seymouri]|eukprot:KPI84060.1 hypothetical protein ABL78_6885 [Leptomonas seymouri]
MYNPGAPWLHGTESGQQREDMKNAILGREGHASSSPVSKPAARSCGVHARDPVAVFFDDDISRPAFAAQSTGGNTASVHVVNGLTQRGPRKPGETFSAAPARYM